MNNTARELKCEDKIEAELKDREDYLAGLYSIEDSGDDVTGDSDDARESIYEMAYGIDTMKVTRVIWSGGGPADWIEIFHNGSGIDRVEYVYQDWYDGARRTVEEVSAIYRYAEEILEMEAQ
jgi:hypothetical protein